MYLCKEYVTLCLFVLVHILAFCEKVCAHVYTHV